MHFSCKNHQFHLYLCTKSLKGVHVYLGMSVYLNEYGSPEQFFHWILNIFTEYIVARCPLHGFSLSLIGQLSTLKTCISNYLQRWTTWYFSTFSVQEVTNTNFSVNHHHLLKYHLSALEWIFQRVDELMSWRFRHFVSSFTCKLLCSFYLLYYVGIYTWKWAAHTCVPTDHPL